MAKPDTGAVTLPDYQVERIGSQIAEGETIKSARPHALTDAIFNYCPGCTHGIVNRLVAEVIDNGAKQFLSVELNMGQMVEDVRLAANGRASVSFYGRTGGVLPTPEEVLEQIERLAEGQAVAPSAGAKAVGSVLPAPIDRKSSYERGE